MPKTMMRSLWQALLEQRYRLLWEAPSEIGVLHLASRHRSPLMEIRTFDVRHDASLLAKRVMDAVALVNLVEPRRFSRMRRDVRYCLVMSAKSSAYWVLTGTCLISEKRARESNEIRIALTLVHEATHARIARAGVHYSTRSRLRVERRCIREQISFVQRLGAAGYEGTDRWEAYFWGKIAKMEGREAGAVQHADRV